MALMETTHLCIEFTYNVDVTACIRACNTDKIITMT